MTNTTRRDLRAGHDQPWKPDVATEHQVAGTAVAPFYKTGYEQQWSIGVQREVVRDTVLDVAYVGNRGISLANSALLTLPRSLDPSPFLSLFISCSGFLGRIPDSQPGLNWRSFNGIST